ncbi:hypothetical protein L9F63_013217, partial [Diploptera punctata]
FQVSWVRHRDIHLLTVGRYTYTSDQRFQSIHSPQTEDWMLQIRYPQRRDSGFYECQVSTTPPIGHSMYLSVVGCTLQLCLDMFASGIHSSGKENRRSQLTEQNGSLFNVARTTNIFPIKDRLSVKFYP